MSDRFDELWDKADDFKAKGISKKLAEYWYIEGKMVGIALLIESLGGDILEEDKRLQAEVEE